MIDCILFSTITPNCSFCPLYITSIVCAPSCFGLYPLIVTLLSVSATGEVATPLAITSWIFPPVRSKSSPYSYFTFVGGVSIIPVI